MSLEVTMHTDFQLTATYFEMIIDNNFAIYPASGIALKNEFLPPNLNIPEKRPSVEPYKPESPETQDPNNPDTGKPFNPNNPESPIPPTPHKPEIPHQPDPNEPETPIRPDPQHPIM
jgi:hypothetical protein